MLCAILEKVCPASDVLHVSYFPAFDLPLPCCNSLFSLDGDKDRDGCVLLLCHILGSLALVIIHFLEAILAR